jgi:hypothetical protein
MRVQPAGARYAVEESESTLRITIRGAGRSGPVFARGLILALGVSGVLLLSSKRMMTAEQVLIPIFALLLALALILVGAYRIAWAITGREVITVTRDALLVSRCIGSLVRTKHYVLADTSGFRIPLENGAWWAEIDAYRSGWERGIIHFDYRRRRRRLGIGLRVPEAQAILALLELRVARR